MVTSEAVLFEKGATLLARHTSGCESWREIGRGIFMERAIEIWENEGGAQLQPQCIVRPRPLIPNRPNQRDEGK